MFIDYALNFTFPWSAFLILSLVFQFLIIWHLLLLLLGLTDQPGFSFNVYNIPDALNPKIAQDPSVWLNGAHHFKLLFCLWVHED